jgi:hypothetical protein
MPMSGTPMQCPRCKKTFTCNKEHIGDCACAQVAVSNETRAFLAKTFYGCLCNECLQTLNDLVAREKEFPFPGRGGDLIEGVHYYTEDVYRVFTEFYHISRGYCCRSGCRHCAYGFKRQYGE